MKEERLEDALQYIDELLELLKQNTPTNDTPEGRTIYELRWFKQEIEANRLTQLPAPREQTSTIRHVFSEHYLDQIDTRRKRLKKLVSLLSNGYYLMKPQFYPLAIEEIDKMRGLLQGVEPAAHDIPAEMVKELASTPVKQITAEKKKSVHSYVLRDLNLLRARFADHTIEPPPVNWDDYRGACIAEENSIFGSFSDAAEDRQWSRVCCLIFEGLRPDPNGKIANRRW